MVHTEMPSGIDSRSHGCPLSAESDDSDLYCRRESSRQQQRISPPTASCSSSDRLPEVDSKIEFTIDYAGDVMGSAEDVMIHCIGRIVRHQTNGARENMAAAVIDEYYLKA